MKTLIATPRSERRARSDLVTPSPRGDHRGIQIGPRIRIGGSVGKVGQKIKIGAGKVLGNPLVDTALAFVPGVGPGLAAGARGLGTALDTSNGSVGLGTIAKNTAMQYGIGKVATSIPGIVKAGASALGIGGGSSAGGASGGGADDSYDDGSSEGEGYNDGGSGGGGGGSSLWDKAKGIFLGGGSDGKGNFGMLGDLAGKAGDVLGGAGGGLLDKALLAASIADAAGQRKKKEDLQKEGLGYTKDAYSARQPLRQRGLELLQDEAPTNLSSIFSNPANQYTKAVPTPQVGTRVPMTPPKLPSGGTY
jgi:hypothetical protein